MGFIFSRLWSNSRQVKEVVLNCLIENEFRPSPEEKDRLHQLISDLIGIMTWNLAAKSCLEKNNDDILAGALKMEIIRWNIFLFNVLSITYDAGSISKIRENLSSNTVESVNYALEMMDIVIDDTIKPKLISLLDAVPDEDKLRNLFHFYPGEVPDYTKLLDDIINRDYNLISIWTKACVLRSIHELEGDDLTESVIALLFSPEKILQEESARLISRTSYELYKTVSKRIPVSSRKHLDIIAHGDYHEEDLLFVKVEFLSGCFNSPGEEELIPLAEKPVYVSSYKEAGRFFPEGCILWRLRKDKEVPEPEMYYSEKSGSTVTDSGDSCYILPFKAIEEHQYQYPENSFEILNYIDKYEVLT